LSGSKEERIERGDNKIIIIIRVGACKRKREEEEK